MKRSLVLLLASSLLAGLFSTGCRKPGGGGGDGTVKILHIYEALGATTQGASYRWVEGIIDQFEAATTWTVQQEQVQWDAIDSKILNDLRSGIPHDVVMASPQIMPRHFEYGSLLDLTPYLAQWSRSEIEEFAWTPSWRKCGREGKRLAMPTGNHARVVIYRKDYFEAAGLDPDRPPADLDELIGYAKKLTVDNDGDGRIDVWGLGLYVGAQRASIELYFAPLLWHFGGDFFDPETGRATFASEAGVQAVEWLADCIDLHGVTPAWAAGAKYDHVIFERFMRGDLAMAWGWGNYWNQALEEEGWTKGLYPPTPGGGSEKVGIFVTPTRDGAQFTNCWAFAIHALSRHPDTAFDLMETMLSPENLADYPDQGLPVRRSTWKQPGYRTPWYRVWQQAVESGRPMPETANYNDLVDTVKTAVQEIILKDADPAETLQRYQDEFNQRHAD